MLKLLRRQNHLLHLAPPLAVHLGSRGVGLIAEKYGEDLSRVSKDWVNYSQEVRLSWMRDLIGMASELRDARILHRDVKPNNICLQHAQEGLPRLKLIDFGKAIPADELHEAPVEVVGVAKYRAPELTDGTAVNGHKVDD